MSKRVLSTFLVLIGALVITLATLTALRVMFLQKQAQLTPAPIPVPSAQTSSGYPLHYVDAFKREVNLSAPPQRIVSISPSMTELIFALGAGDRLVADTRFCLNPPAAIAKPKIGGVVDPDIEKILGFNPDLVVCSELTPKDIADQMDRLGLHSAYFRNSSIASLLRDIIDLSNLLGVPERGVKLAGELHSQIDGISAPLKSLPPAQRPKVLFLIRADELFSAGRGTFPDELIQLAGGENIAAHAATAWPQLSMEAILTANPDIILFAISKTTEDQTFVENQRKLMQADPRWKQVKAVADGRFVAVSNDLLTAPGTGLPSVLQILAKDFHPELFPGTQPPK